VRWKALKAHNSKDLKWQIEIRKVASMLIFLRSDKQEPGIRGPLKQTLYHYTCRHFDPATKNCTAYNERPDMCRNYPYSGAKEDGSCKYKGCTRRCEIVSVKDEKKALDKVE